MSKKVINILSIDFDFFQVVDEATMYNYYPDGSDRGTAISNMVWTSRYADEANEQALKAVKVDKVACGRVNAVIKANASNCKMNMIANSHVHMMQMLNKLAVKDAVINVYNLDMHHDMFDSEVVDGKLTSSRDLDCGNWATYAKIQHNANIIWIKNPASDNAFPSTLPDEQTTDLSIIENVDFDDIFLCRSDSWLPPHLDNYFDKMKSVMRNTFESTFLDRQVDSPRDIMKDALELRKSLRAAKKAVAES